MGYPVFPRPLPRPPINNTTNDIRNIPPELMTEEELSLEIDKLTKGNSGESSKYGK